MNRREMLTASAGLATGIFGLLATTNAAEKVAEVLANGDKAKKEYLIKECGLTYDHLGIPTQDEMKWDAYLENLKVHIQEYENDPFGIEWMKFEEGSPLPEIIQKRPHVAFVVNNMDKAIKGYDLLVPISSPRPGMTTCFIVHKGIAIEFVSRTASATEQSNESVSRLGNVTVEIKPEVADQEGIKEWAEKARQLVIEWYPKMDQLLASDGFVPPKDVTLVFEKMDGVAATGGNVIHISADWIKRQPGDFGMVAHELVHVIQNYPRRTGPGWVTEGIADYVRHAHYEPEVPMPRINPDRASYRDAYKTTAGFFIWIEKTYDKDFVKKLNIAMRERTYSDDIFEKSTGKKLDDLWKEYADTFRK